VPCVVPSPRLGKANVFDHPSVFEPVFFSRPHVPSDMPKYPATAFDRWSAGHTASDNQVTQLNLISEQGFLPLAKSLSKARTALPLWLRLIFALLLRIGALLGWAMGHEPLTFGAVIGTLCTTTTAASYSLNSADPTVPLVSDEPPLSGGDVDALVHAARQCRRVAACIRDTRRGRWYTPHGMFEAVVYGLLRMLRLTMPRGPASRKDDDEAFMVDDMTGRDASRLRRHVRARCGTLWHPMGGAAMGTVVSPSNLCVIGTANVHVAGTACLPSPLRVNPMASCYAMAWRLAELLAEQGEYDLEALG